MSMDVHELKRRLDAGEQLTLLDVREPDEVAICRIEGSTWIPMREVPNRAGELPDGVPIVVYCHAGMRSAQVVRYLREHAGRDDAANLTGGIEAWSVNIDPAVPRY